MKFPWHALSPPARRALLCHALYWQAVIMAFTFVNVYLFRLGHGYADPAYYQMLANAVIPLGFVAGAYIARRQSSAATYRAGLILHEVFLLLILILRERCVDHLFVVGILSGLATGFYWQGWILMMVDLSGEESRDAMLGSQQWVYFVAGLTGAPLAGWFLSPFADLQGYNYVFAFSSLLFAAAWWVSRPIQTSRLHGAPSLLRLIKARKPHGWAAMSFSSVLMGLLSVSALFLTTLISFESKGNESGTGQYTLLNAGLGFAATWFMARYGARQTRLRTLAWAGLVVAVVALPLAFQRSFALIMLYGAGMAIALSFFNVALFVSHLSILSSKASFHARRADALVMRESWIAVGRVAGYAFIMLMVGNIDSKALGFFFVAIAVTPLLNTWVMRRYV